MRAILEMELPESCLKCSLFYKKIHYVDTHYMCAGLNKELEYSRKAETQRYSSCPLKIIKEANRQGDLLRGKE